MLEFAAAKCGQPHWRFEVANEPRIPEEDGRRRHGLLFLRFHPPAEEESFLYLQEARRVLLPGGRWPLPISTSPIQRTGRFLKQTCNRPARARRSRWIFFWRRTFSKCGRQKFDLDHYRRPRAQTAASAPAYCKSIRRHPVGTSLGERERVISIWPHAEGFLQCPDAFADPASAPDPGGNLCLFCRARPFAPFHAGRAVLLRGLVG